MYLHEHAVYPRRHRRPRQRFDEFRLATGGDSSTTRQLDAMGGVEDYRPARIPHDLQPAHIHHQVVVAEAGAPLRKHHLRVAGRGDFVGRAVDIVGSHELAFLDVHDAAGPAGGYKKVRLAAKEGRYLEDIRHLGDLFGLRRLVDIGEHGEARGLHACQDAQPLTQPRPPIGLSAGAIGLVEGSFENEVRSLTVAVLCRNGTALVSKRSSDYFEDGARHPMHVLFTFDHARTSDEDERLAVREGAELKGHACTGAPPALGERLAGGGFRKQRQ